MANHDERMVRHHIGGLDEGDAFSDAQELADAFGGAVFAPSRWPRATRSVRYLLSIPVQGQVPRARHYRIIADLEDHPSPFVQNAETGSLPCASEGWEDIPRLAPWGGLARYDVRSAQVVLEREEHVIHLISFPSVDDAVEAALSLRRHDPAPR